MLPKREWANWFREHFKDWLRREWGTLLSTTLGTAVICFALVALVVPYKFAGAGVTGIALITNYLWGISPVWVITVGNALLLVWGWRYLSTRFALWTLYVSVLTSRQVPPLKRFIASLDPAAFVIFSEVSEVVGEGFKSWRHA